jgi:putative hydrolase of the HAD superfamily
MPLLHPHYKTPLKWIFFDLDNTLWDFDANADQALRVLFERHYLGRKTGYSAAQFIALYQEVNHTYWKRYEKGEVQKEVLRTARFTDTFSMMGLSPELHPVDVWQEYLEICPRMTLTISGAYETLSYAHSKVSIGVLTNGFEETQRIKLKTCNLELFVDFMQSSEALGSAKPSLEFFNEALNRVQIDPKDCLYIGDNVDTDVWGGIHAGIYTYRYKYNGISSPAELQSHALFGGDVSSLIDWIHSL